MFKISLVPPLPNGAVLEDTETVAGLEFIEIAESSLRRVLEDGENKIFEGLGRIRTYDITIPTETAMKSGLFSDKNTVYVVVPNNFLKQFLFYSVVSSGGAGTHSYGHRYTFGKSVIVSTKVDEFAVIDAWEKFGYSTNIVKDVEGENGCHHPSDDEELHHHHHHQHYPCPQPRYETRCENDAQQQGIIVRKPKYRA